VTVVGEGWAKYAAEQRKIFGHCVWFCNDCVAVDTDIEEDGYFRCNKCGKKLGKGSTEVTV
jgi:DNA-directed RNA polymerase subunit RPC12/RpoP